MVEEKMKQITLSVIMPVYNGEQYLNYSIQSVLNQTYKDYELILVDDGSTDHSLEICEKYQSKDKRIRVISQENKGISGARNAGIDIATGEYITFMDSDDVIQPKMYEIMLNHMVSDGLDLIMCGAVRTGNYNFQDAVDQYEICKLTKKDLYERIFANSNVDWEYMAVWNKIYKTEYVRKIKFAKRGTEDAVFNCQYFKYIQNAKLIDQKLYYWIQRKGSISHSEFSLRDYYVLEDYYWMNQYVEKHEREYIQYSIVKLYKLVFNSRYRARNTELKNKIEQIIKKNDKSIKNIFYENDKICSKIKILFTIFYYIPVTYNMFRWINEKRAR
ncbi:glycosyltransferase family 2 protein [Anaerostipes sp.]|uniref:glycosyltransferase family 2 protein n=1 Tax=Anaerostipes sp. TaxID=1872530 RepID=UPI003967B01C